MAEMWKVYSIDPKGDDYFVDEFDTREGARNFARGLRARLPVGWHTRVEDWRDPQWFAMQREG
jgi:hypothetical protein